MFKLRPLFPLSRHQLMRSNSHYTYNPYLERNRRSSHTNDMHTRVSLASVAIPTTKKLRVRLLVTTFTQDGLIRHN